MSHNHTEKDSNLSNDLKKQIESREIILKADLLEIRHQAAEKIQKAAEKAGEEYQNELRKIRDEEEKFHQKARHNFEVLVDEISQSEEKTLESIKNNFHQRKMQVINDLLRLILPLE